MASYSNCASNSIHAPLKHPATPMVGDRLRQAILAAVRGIWAQLSADPNQPRVRSYRSHAGEMVWDAYDPRSGRSFTCTSEAEMRAWLESRYYHS
jgi:hypothetical protein